MNDKIKFSSTIAPFLGRPDPEWKKLVIPKSEWPKEDGYYWRRTAVPNPDEWHILLLGGGGTGHADLEACGDDRGQKDYILEFGERVTRGA